MPQSPQHRPLVQSISLENSQKLFNKIKKFQLRLQVYKKKIVVI
jgi:hypothetical protein